MTALMWDTSGKRFFEAGVDRGVLYPPNAPGVVWNGLVSLEEQSSRDVKPYYLEGVKYLEVQVLSDYAAKLKAFTYPDEFEVCIGIQVDSLGLTYHDQPGSRFGLSYRTRLGNEQKGLDFGYRIHLLYDLCATSDNIVYSTLGKTVDPTDFAWSITAIPTHVPGRRPTAHLSFRSTDISNAALAAVEAVLYGSGEQAPRLPAVDELLELLMTESYTTTITDNGDGTWSADAPDAYLTMLDYRTFQLTNVDTVYIDSGMYTVSTTENT